MRMTDVREQGLKKLTAEAQKELMEKSSRAWAALREVRLQFYTLKRRTSDTYLCVAVCVCVVVCVCVYEG
jgi:hypothetical protein